MTERVTIRRVSQWCMCIFTDCGHCFEIKMMEFGDSKLPVVYVYSLSDRSLSYWRFQFILENWTPVDPNADTWDYSDKVSIDFDRVLDTYHSEIKQFYIDTAKKGKLFNRRNKNEKD